MNRVSRTSQEIARRIGPLDQPYELTTAEKISAMEYLWDDLCRHASKALSPAWHGDVLAEREEAVTAGEAEGMNKSGHSSSVV